MTGHPSIGWILAACLAFAGLGFLSFFLSFGTVQGAEEVPAENKAVRDVYSQAVRPLLARYCFSCHGEKNPKGGLNLTSFPDRKESAIEPQTWKPVWERVKSRQMPPPGRPQPAAQERERLLSGIEDVFAQHTLDGHPDPGPLHPRRLNVREYRNSLRDLVVARSSQPRRLTYSLAAADGRIRFFDSQPEHVCAFVDRTLPQDTNDGGFDTIGENLSIPPFLMEKYLRCTKILLDEAFSANAKSGGDFAGPWQLRVRWERIQKGPLPKNATLREAVAGLLRELATSAFRRPVTRAEVEKYVQLFDLAQGKGEDFETSIRLPIQAILVSPRFVVLWGDPVVSAEGKATAPVRPLDSYELASRLSYFVWSSPADQELLRLAAQGKLNDPQVIEEQVRRMLKERRVRYGLMEGFVYQWLQLDKLERAAPDAERYAVYFQNNLGELMKRELILFTDTLTFEDRSILEFVDADWGFLCQPLAEHYEIANFPGKKLRDSEGPWYRWKFTDKQRGGVLTMGVVLTGTSQPLRTSPVARGKWILETILGTPPPPPPPDVDNVLKEEKQDNNLTVRQRMERHRANAACASCHRLIDPLGMALETFDPIGKWRDKDQGQPIDASGTLTDGVTFRGIAELKALLLSRKEDVVRSFVEHMLAYALGRKLEYYDAPTVTQITKAVVQDDCKFSRVVVEVARSYPFRQRRLKEVEK